MMAPIVSAGGGWGSADSWLIRVAEASSASCIIYVLSVLTVPSHCETGFARPRLGLGSLVGRLVWSTVQSPELSWVLGLITHAKQMGDQRSPILWDGRVHYEFPFFVDEVRRHFRIVLA